MSTVVPAETSTDVTVDPVLDSAPTDEEHIVCCREVSEDGPLMSFCGKPQTREDLNAIGESTCEACQKVGASLAKFKIVNKRVVPKYTCIRDGAECPIGNEADDLFRSLLDLD